MSESPMTSRLANTVAREICRAFVRFQNEFREITQRGKVRFAQRDWAGMHADSAARLDVYKGAIDQVVDCTRTLLADRTSTRSVWAAIKAAYSGLIVDRDDWEIAETFFNSVTRRIFTTVGVDEKIEFVHGEYARHPASADGSVEQSFAADGPLAAVVQKVLRAHELGLGEKELQRESRIGAEEIQRRLAALGHSADIQRIDMIKAPFYRGEHLHLIGRMLIADRFVPLVISFCHAEAEILLDSVLVQEDDVSLLFSYTRSYFFVDVARPSELVRFIKTIIPRKPRAEIYISIGYNKHGKTELYRHALRHLARSSDKYQLALGQRGMVMVVFTMPSYPVVFKIIKDEFDYPKSTSRQAVIDRYHLVFRHDRAGRLIDAQEYEYLTLQRQDLTMNCWPSCCTWRAKRSAWSATAWSSSIATPNGASRR